MFVGEIGLVNYELYVVDAVDVALYLVDDQRYQDHVD